MVRPTRFVHGGLALLLALVGWLLVFSSARAFADPYMPPTGGATEPPLEGLGTCPAGPVEPYEGEDHAALELRLLRAEFAESCSALAARADEVSHRLWWVVAEAARAQEQRVLTNTLLSETRDRLAAPVPVSVEDWTYELPLDTQDASSAESSADVVSAVDATGTALKEALWFLSGLLVMLAGSALYRHLKP